ncbi:MAG: PH domain-containing protein [Planctomycetales bacterium]|nr:PH domain-containing protein [Planctomycetales bacterium]
MNETPQFDPKSVVRPDKVLMRYYIITSLLTGPAAPLLILGFYCRYITLRYKFDDSGVSMSWGVLFRKEIYLTYKRIQDIHLTRNIIQRWMGLAKISLQTASGNSQAEMSIEGFLNPEEIRDYLYSQMRGAKNELLGSEALATDAPACQQTGDRATQVLREIRDAMQKLVAMKSSGGDA